MTVLKVALGVILGLTVLIVGCSALVSTGLDSQQKKNAITNEEYQSVKRGDPKDQLISDFGKPNSSDQYRDKIQGVGKIESDCAYWNLSEEDVGSFAQVCFQGGRVQSKSRYAF